MFTPSIYITHKTLRQIVDLELSNQEFTTTHKHLIPKYGSHFMKSFILDIQPKYSVTIRSESIIQDFIKGNKEIKDLQPLNNAIQATNSHKNSLRAEDDWNLLFRIFQLISKENLSVRATNLRSTDNIKEKCIIDLHHFDNSEQLQHFLLELFRWYRTSDTEMNNILRLLCILYHLLKTSPFENKNYETILIIFTFFIRENNLELLNTINIPNYLHSLKNPKIELNEFIGKFLDKFISDKNKLFYEIEKLNLESTAPKKILNLNQRQIQLLKIMQAREKISRKEAADILEVSFMTAYRDIKNLTKKKLLIEQGVGRGTYYVLASK